VQVGFGFEFESQTSCPLQRGFTSVYSGTCGVHYTLIEAINTIKQLEGSSLKERKMEKVLSQGKLEDEIHEFIEGYWKMYRRQTNWNRISIVV